MTESLSTAEIDKLLDGVPEEDQFFNLEEFTTYLTSRNTKDPNTYGKFEKNISILKFFDDPKGESILSDIREINSKENMGNIKIPGTEIELLNYSYCPKCRTIHSYQDLLSYYSNPIPNPGFRNKLEQFRKDTTLACKNCKSFFIPAIVIVDGTPKNEAQFLCRIQTVEEVESFFDQMGSKVLSKNPANKISKDNWSAIRNDVDITKLKEKPTLIVNMMQYTPVSLLDNFIEGKNLSNDDFLFGHVVRLTT